MEAIVLTLLQLVLSLLPSIGVDNTAVNKILSALIQIVPLVVNMSQTILQSVQNVIATLKTSGNLTADQLTALDQLSAEIDANWQSSVDAYLASKKKVIPPAVQILVPSSDSVSPASPITAATAV